jgi:transcriptional regulator with XRE-family HTH domain
MTKTAGSDRPARRAALRIELYARVERGEVGLVEAVRMMRKIADKTQAEYATLVGVSARVLIDFERGVGNPTLRSIEKMLGPFGLELTVRRRRSDDGDSTVQPRARTRSRS